jgi:Rrf2 family protein
MLSLTAEYALRTAVFLAERADTPVRIDEMAHALEIPRNYLSKILYRLAKERVLTSARGQKGGFRLARPADRIRLLDVVEPFDHLGTQRRCLLGREACTDQQPCEAHAAWKEVGARITTFFVATTVADLLRSGRARRVR